ncbi:MAG: leishmanolysin-related zinc metalloendopeptidase [Microthrixaceae bacterium]
MGDPSWSGRWWRSRWCRSRSVAGVLAFVVPATALLASCAPPPDPVDPAPPGPPTIEAFSAGGARQAAPVVATYRWRVDDPNGDRLTCRVDIGADGTYEHRIEPCRNADSVLAEFDEPGVHRAVLEVSDGYSVPVTAEASLSVAPGPDEPYDITLRLDPSMRAEFRYAFEAAAERWERVLVAGAPDARLDLPQGLFGWVPGFSGRVDDVLIDARGGVIDGPGKVLGQAGGLLVRQPDWQPYWGIMNFDEADLDVLHSEGRLDQVILHEMGHVLGLGANWLFTGMVQDLLVDPAYSGSAGVAAFQELGGDRWVPLENGGGLGTAVGHWRESVFGDELMTGYLGSRPVVMSRVTVAALADLGYGVDLSAADPYTLASAPALTFAPTCPGAALRSPARIPRRAPCRPRGHLTGPSSSSRSTRVWPHRGPV